MSFNDTNSDQTDPPSLGQSSLGLLLPRVILVRHARTQGNINRTIYSAVPNKTLPLSPEGAGQAEAVGKALGDWFARNGIKSATIWTSDYERAMQTEAFAQPSLGIAVATHRSHDLREADYGLCDGMPEQEMWAKFGPQLALFEQDQFNNSRPGGESRRQVADRVERFLIDHAAPEMARSGNDVLVIFSHSVTQRALGMILTGSDPSFIKLNKPQNCEAWLIENGRMSVLFDGYPEPKAAQAAHAPATPVDKLPLESRAPAAGARLAVPAE